MHTGSHSFEIAIFFIIFLGNLLQARFTKDGPRGIPLGPSFVACCYYFW